MPEPTQRLVDPDGQIRDVPESQAAAAYAAKWRPATTEDSARTTTEAANEQDFGGIGGAAKATGYGIARGVSLGLSDLAFRAGGATPEHLRGLEEHNPVPSAVGEGIGTLIPSLVAPTSLLGRSPAGATSRIGRAILDSAEHSGVLAKAGAAAVSAGTEGALYGGGHYLSQVALEDKPLSAEGFFGAVGTGGLFGAPIGGGLSLLGSGLKSAGGALQRARSLFPQRQVTKAAAEAVDQQAKSVLTQAVSDGDQMAEAVRRRIALTETKIGMAEAGEGVTRRVFGAADPAAMGDQISGGAERATMTDALKRYEASKAQLSDWIREEADPALEASLTGLVAPELGTQGPWRAKAYARVFGEPEVPTSQLDLKNQSLSDALDARGKQLDVTAVGRKRFGAVELPPAGTPDEQIQAQLTAVGKKSVAPVTAVGERPAAIGEPVAPSPLTEEEYQQFKSGATFDPADAQALKDHSGNGLFAQVNSPLRKGNGDLDELPERLAEHVAKVDRAIASSPTPRDMVVSRGMNHDAALRDWHQLKPGDSIVDHGFGSMTVDPDVSYSYSNGFNVQQGVEVVATVPKGFPAAPVPSSHFDKEKEILFPRGTKYTITDVTIGEDGRKIIHATVSPAAVGEASSIAAKAEEAGALAATDIESMSLKQLNAKYDELRDLKNSLDTAAHRKGPEFQAAKDELNAVSDRMQAIRKGLVTEPVGSAKPDPSGFRQIDRAAGGSQGGKWYQHEDGSQWFGKVYNGESARVKSEHLANRLYRAFGVSAPETRVRWVNGKQLLLSKEIEGSAARSAADLLATDARDGFVVDAWLGNWDVVGTGYDNILTAGGKAHRIDNGGATIWRAQGGRKEFTAPVRELETMRDVSKPAGEVFGGIPQQQLDRQLLEFADSYAAKKSTIDKIVKESGLNEDLRDEVLKGLHDRGAWIQKEAEVARGRLASEAAKSAPATAPTGRITVSRAPEGAPRGAMVATMPDGSIVQLSKAKVRDWAESQMPPGFRTDVTIETHRPFSIEPGIPTTAKDIRDNAVYVLKPSDLVERGLQGNELNATNLGKMAEARADAGVRLAPIRIDVTPEGRLFVEDGNHRLQVAAKSDAPVAVHFKPTMGGWKPQAGARDITERLRGELPTAPSAAPESLESQLLGTKAKLDSGATIADVGAEAPARKQYVADKLEARAQQASAYRAAAAEEDTSLEALLRGTKKNLDETGSLGSSRKGGYEASDMAREERIAQEEAAARRAPKAHVDEPSRQDDIQQPAEPPLVALADEVPPARDIDRTKVDKAIRGLVRADMDAQRTVVDGDIRARMDGVSQDDQIARMLTKHVGKDVNMGVGIAKAAKIINDFESAGADLVEILGAEAPAGAAARAQGYKAAAGLQADAAAASTAKAAAHIKDKLAPEIAAATAGDTGSVLGKVADVGGAMEILGALGVHVPSLAAIPVIGPILSLFLKAKAVMGIIGRKGGSVGRSTESVIAGKAADVRNRMNSATIKALDVAGRGAHKASGIAAGPAVTLATRLFPGGKEPKSKDPRVLYTARMDELGRALQPGAIEHAVSDRVQTGDPHLQDAIVSQAERALKFLDSKAPRETVMPTMLPSDGKWHPSKTALEKWGRYVHAVNDPASVLEDLAKGHVTMEGAEALRVVYPALYAEAQRTLLEHAAQMQETLPYARRVMISIIYQVPVDGTMTPSHIQYLQPPLPQAPGMAPGMAAPQGTPGLTGPLNLAQQTMTSLDRRAGM